MLNKLKLQKKAQYQEEQHLTNATAAADAHEEHSPDRRKGVERVVDKHLRRIMHREYDYAEFAGIVADSPSLKVDDE